jgi:hypothetical protein
MLKAGFSSRCCRSLNMDEKQKVTKININMFLKKTVLFVLRIRDIIPDPESEKLTEKIVSKL